MTDANEVVLYVDDERENRTAFEYAFDEFTVRTAPSGHDALELLRRGDIAVLLADQRMPGMTGVELCMHARSLAPDAFRIIVTAYADVQVATDAINRGEVSRFIMKPWRNADLAEVIRAGIERVRIERAVREVQGELVRKGLGGIAVGSVSDLVHELVLPLRALEHHLTDAARTVERLEATAPERASALRALNAATESAALTSALLRRVSHHVQVTSGPKTCDAQAVVAASVRIASSYAQRIATLDTRLELTQSDVAIDARSLGEVTLNLVVNAAEALEADAAPDAAPTIEVRLCDAGANVLLSVEDNGPGLDAAALASMFEPGVSTKGEGRGVGLAVVRSLVREVGGDVRARSEPGRGCTIEVQLPRPSPSERA
jgi:C4-dicarboxylate-specific signal transduction histidine kinase